MAEIVSAGLVSTICLGASFNSMLHLDRTIFCLRIWVKYIYHVIVITFSGLQFMSNPIIPGVHIMVKRTLKILHHF